MSTIGTDLLISMYRAMYVTRKAESRLVELYRQNLVKGTVLTGEGNEAAVVGLMSALDRETTSATSCSATLPATSSGGRRSRSSTTTTSAIGTARQAQGRERPPRRPAASPAPDDQPPRAMLPNVVGATYALRANGLRSVGVAIVGDGGTSTGDFHEALNIASVLEVPVLFFVENNHWPTRRPTRASSASSGSRNAPPPTASRAARSRRPTPLRSTGPSATWSSGFDRARSPIFSRR